MLSAFSLEDKIVLVTGATKGLGYGMAKGAAEAGADLVVVSRHQKDCDRVAAEIEEMGRRALPCAADVREISSIDALVEQAVQEFGRIDVLVNNAGTAVTKPPEEITEEDWDSVLDINLKGAFFAAQRVGKQMIRQGHGNIINISSVFGFVGDANISPYCASKGGLIQITRAFALAWARYNIRVNALAPGYIETEMNRDVLNQEKVHKHIMRNTPLKRLGNLNDVIGAVVYLASPASDFMTGQTVIIDGGWTAQ